MLSAVETKVPGYFGKIRDEVVDRDRGKDESGTGGTDTMTFQDDELSYPLGKQGGRARSWSAPRARWCSTSGTSRCPPGARRFAERPRST